MASPEIADVNGERKHRKSVAFSEGTTMIDSNGDVTTGSGHSDRTTADSHSIPNGAVDDATALMDDLDLTKKKKKKKVPKEDAGDEVAATEAPAGDADFDPTVLKKKKKKKTPKADDDFEAKLAEAGVADKDGSSAKDDADADADADGTTTSSAAEAGDMDKGTGIWAHDATQPIQYDLLLSRFFKLLNAHNPDLMSGGSRSYKIPPPQCLREGNKKTIFANIAEICRRMKRTEEHVTMFLFAELGTNGSVDGSRRLVIKGRFQQKQIENVLRRYIVEYVTCKTCRSPDTELLRGENRLYFVNCNSCGSRRSVTAIKAGFTAQVGKRKRPQA